jgi:signal transduction histidine kinase
MRRNELIRIGILVLLVVGVTSLHYLTTIQKTQFHDIYRRLYYLPIVLGGLWYGLRGGIGVSLAASLLYAPHVLFQWGNWPLTDVEQYLEILLYNVIGGLTGFLAQQERAQKQRYQKAAGVLEKSYAQLREQADQILEIEEQLRRADRLSALGELSAGMAHEIRNPLGSIRGTAEILREAVPPDDPRAEFADIMLREVDRLNGVVQDFLDFARPGESDRERIQLATVIRDLLALVRQQARKGGIEVVCEAPVDVEVLADGEQLRQAFLNLVLNAFQAMPEGGRLEVSLQVVGERVLVRFRDNGAGIEADHLERIFNPFFTTRSSGTGLGLAITHRIVQAHNGRIQVTSTRGEGTTFELSLPLAGTGRRERA